MEKEKKPHDPVSADGSVPFKAANPVAPHPAEPDLMAPQATPQLPTVAATPHVSPHGAGPAPIAWEWPAIHPESYRFAGIAGAIAVVCGLAGWYVVAALMLLLTGAILAFFRDPRRASPAGEGLIISPADGLVSQIIEAEVPRQLVGDGGLEAGTAIRVSIFMSVFDVHINRAPIGGTVKRIAYVPGAFVNAVLDKASEENERQYILIESANGTRVGFTQIAGLVARRIVGFVREGVVVGQGQRVGLIRFGSRVDVFLPADHAPQVVKGQRAVAGETVIARRGAAAAVTGPRA